MGSEENYLNNLLDGVTSSEAMVQSDDLNIDSLEMPEALEVEIPDVEMPDVEISDIEIPDLDISDLQLSNIVMPENEYGMAGAEVAEDSSIPGQNAEEDASFEEIEDASFDDLFGGDRLELDSITESQSDDSFLANLMNLEESSEDFSEETPHLEVPSEDLFLDSDSSVGEPSVEECDTTDIGIADELQSGDLQPEVSADELQLQDWEPEITESVNLDTGGHVLDDADMPDVEAIATELPEQPDIPDTGEELNLEDIEMPGSEDDFKLEDLGMSGDMPFQESELNIDGLDQAIQSETELQMAGELNIDELGIGDVGSGSDISASMDMDDSLEDVLNMLDDDSELAEINDMLKKSDNNEPIQDDMMDLLHQMADDEAASVNAGIKHVDDEDDGVPLPEIPRVAAETSDNGGETKKKDKKDKKAAKKKKREKDEPEEKTESAKETGKLGKFFNMLTEDIVPEPTEEELAAEKEAKEAKKQENKTKKEEEKLAKAEEKKAKAEEKAAADRVKQEAAAQKKKEKQAKKEAAKAAKAAAEVKKKRIPPKKIAVAVVFGASVGGAIVLATNILSTQGFLQTARSAYYDGDYKRVYEATYGMELDDSETDGLIKAKSEVIFKIQRRYDSYQTNLKMGREVEALDALLQGITVYDNINADAERYGVTAEVDAVRTNILNVLETEYGLDETAARALINNQDAVSYTIALNEVIAGK